GLRAEGNPRLRHEPKPRPDPPPEGAGEVPEPRRRQAVRADELTCGRETGANAVVMELVAPTGGPRGHVRVPGRVEQELGPVPVGEAACRRVLEHLVAEPALQPRQDHR